MLRIFRIGIVIAIVVVAAGTQGAVAALAGRALIRAINSRCAKN